LRSKLPTLRPRRRYVAFFLNSEKEPQARELMVEIHSIQASLMGDLGTARNRLKLIYFDGHFGILRCSHDKIQDTRVILAAVHSINGARAAIWVKGISGTIKSVREKYLPRLDKMNAEKDGRRIELDEVSGCIIYIQGCEIDLCPDDQSRIKGSDTRYLGLTSYDLYGGLDDANGTSDGL